MLQPSVRQTLDVLDTLPDVPQTDELRDPPIRDKIIAGRGAVAEKIYALLEHALGARTYRRSLAVFLDGLPGSGKSGMGEKIREGAVSANILSPDQIAVLSLDRFVGTQSGSPERTQLTSNAAFFDCHYIRYGQAREVTVRALDAIAHAKPHRIPIENEYRRDLGGKFADGAFELKPDVRLLLVEGVGAIDRVAGPNGFPPEIDRHTVFMYGRNKQSLFRAALRDVRRKPGVTFEGAYAERVREYVYLLRQLRYTPRHADQICQRYKSDKEYLRRLHESDKEGSPSVANIISHVHGEFLQRAVHDPQILRDFSSGRMV